MHTLGKVTFCVLLHKKLVFQMLQPMLREITWFLSRPCICLNKYSFILKYIYLYH